MENKTLRHKSGSVETNLVVTHTCTSQGILHSPKVQRMMVQHLCFFILKE